MVFWNIQMDSAIIKSDIKVRKDKIDSLISLYAAITMKIAAGVNEDWEWVIIHSMKFDKEIRTLLRRNGTDGYISLNHEAWLTALAPYLEDGFIDFSFIEYMGRHRYEINGGELHHVEAPSMSKHPKHLIIEGAK